MSLLVAARTSGGLVVAATLLNDVQEDAGRVGDAVRKGRPAAVVSIDQIYAGAKHRSNNKSAGSYIGVQRPFR